MNNNIKSNTSFWSEISEYQIQVPYYQRDYAQGRMDNGRIDNIRKVFVEELYDAIKGQNKCHLGLVFGSYNENEKVFVAVDGQQRLTTVFLLHWYVAWREKKLNDYREKLLNFSWDTRSYSSQFVELLFKIQPSYNVIDAIKTNSNYFSVWENDPTVKGMLTMLEEIESQYSQDDCNLCNSLFADNCNIQYDILFLEKNSDGKTYLKMNSRGRSLTTFELFKSKFLDKYHPNFGLKFDNEWLSFMLAKFATNDSQFSDPDIPFMNFINEYTYLQLKLKSDSDNSNDYKEFIDAKVKGELTDIPYISFDKYNCAFEDGCLEYFEKSLDWIRQNYDIIKQIDDEVRFCDSKFFIDDIIKGNNPNFSHRAKLFATFKYAELTKYVEIAPELYKKWTRVFRNLVANTVVDGSNIGAICKAINKIDNTNIYHYLSTNGKELSGFNQRQVTEEISKANQILDESGNIRIYDGPCKKEDGSDYQTWEEIIINAETLYFFEGAIAFLFNDINGQPTSWNLFARKLERAKQIFDENGLKEDNLIDTLHCLYSYCENWDTQLWKYHKIFNGLAATWKYNILTQVDRDYQYVYASPVHHILMGDRPRSEIKDNRIMMLANRSLIEYIIKHNENKKDMYIRWPHDALYFCGDKRGVLLSHYRNGIILNMMLKNIRFQLNNKDMLIPDTNLLWGFDIDMIYKEQERTIYFRWYRERNNHTYDIYLMDNQWNYIRRPIEKGEEQGDRKNYYCFNVDRDTPNVVESIIENLKLEQAEIDSNK